MARFRVVVVGGGTGGHVYPALAVIGEMRGRGVDVLYVGTPQGLEADLVPREGIEFHPIQVTGLRGKSPGQVVLGMGRAGAAVLSSLRLLSRLRPHAVLGTGGYVTGPVALAAITARIPVVLQEQNVVPGATNRLLSPLCAAVCVPYARCVMNFPPRARLVVTGNPVRPAVVARTREEGCRSLGLDPGRPVLLVLGGSRGARRLLEAAIAAIPRLRASLPGLQSLLITGREYYTEALALLDRTGEREVSRDWHLEPYIYNMEDALAAADLVVGRAGAMTVAEVTARGLPAVLVPSPNVVGNHQEYNARLLEEAGAARVLREEQLHAESLAETVQGLLGAPLSLRQMGEKSRQLGKPDAARRVAEVVMASAGRRGSAGVHGGG